MRINFLKASILTIFILGGQWLLLSSNVEAVVLNNDFSDEHTYPNKEWEEIVEVLSDENDYDFDRVQTAIDGLEALPDFMLDTILEKEIGIKIINFAIPDLVGFSRFENEKVPGLSDDATFRDDVSGLYYVDFYESVIIARSDTANETISTLYHEVGHAMSDGDFEFTNLKHPDIKEIHKEEKENISPDDNYYDDIGEYYAESFSYYFTEENKDTLLEKAPRTYEYIDKFVNYPLIVDESDMEKIKIKWPDYEGATSYDVYKDGKKIDNVEDTFYSDSDYNEETHIYTVKALDENKNEIFDYYEFRITTMWLEKSRGKSERS